MPTPSEDPWTRWLERKFITDLVVNVGVQGNEAARILGVIRRDVLADERTGVPQQARPTLPSLPQ
jgi:hypothetical protein